MRRGNELIDFDDDDEDDDDDDDYSADEDLDMNDDKPLRDAFLSSTIVTSSTTTTSSTAPKRRTKTTSTVMNEVIESKTANEKDAVVSSSSRHLPELICLLISFSSVHGSLRLTDLFVLQNDAH